MGKGYQKGGYQEERQYGKGKGRGKARDDSRLRRDDSIERRYNAPPSAYINRNGTAFILCLYLYVRRIIVTIRGYQLQSLECFVKFQNGSHGYFADGRDLAKHPSLSSETERTFPFSRIYARYQQLFDLHYPSRPKCFCLWRF